MRRYIISLVSTSGDKYFLGFFRHPTYIVSLRHRTSYRRCRYVNEKSYYALKYAQKLNGYVNYETYRRIIREDDTMLFGLSD